MQVLFVWDANGQSDDATGRKVIQGASEDDDMSSQALKMAWGAWEQREITDAWVERLAPQWPPRRQPGVDRALIRLAVWEITAAGTPPKVAIDEAIELSKEFSTENSPAFINGVLDGVMNQRTAVPDTVEQVSSGAVEEDQQAADHDPSVT